MDFRRPVKATPIRLGETYRRRQQRRRLVRRAKQGALFVAVSLSVFAGGMAFTRPDLVPMKFAASDVRAGMQTCSWLSVHDGDTIRCGTERVRLADIDAPELEGSPRCTGYRAARSWCDYDLGIRSRDTLKEFLHTGTVELVRQGKDKYGRTLAIVRVNGVSAGDHLVGLELARRWQ